MKDLQKILSGGDLRSTGKVNEVVSVISVQRDFDKLFPFLFHPDRLIVMRAADAIEKISRRHPGFLDKYKKDILRLMQRAVNKELKWHIALLLPRLSFNKTDQQKIGSQLSTWLLDKKESRIVRVNALQALYEVKQKFNLPEIVFSSIIKLLERENTPSILARLKKLKGLNHPKP